MPSGRNQGLVQTVLGPVPPSELGPTTTHEHIYIDFSFMYQPAQDTPSPEMADAPITLENLGWIRRNYYSNRSNLHLMDLNTTIKEVAMYREVGGGAIVDATTTAIGRRPDALARISRESGVHIIMGAPASMWVRSILKIWTSELSKIWRGRFAATLCKVWTTAGFKRA